MACADASQRALRSRRSARPSQSWRALLALLLALRACDARPFTPEVLLDAPDGGDSAAAHVAAHAAAAVARGAPFWRGDIVLALTWHNADIEWLAQLPLRHVRAPGRVLARTQGAPHS